MIDIHCHIVPGVDDGAPNTTVALDMIRQAKQTGITGIFTTPHIRSHPAEQATHAFHKKAFAELVAAHADSDVSDVKLKLSGEVRVTPDAFRIFDDPTFTYGEMGKYILLELASQEVPPFFSQLIFEFRLRGVTPIVAHPERNLTILRHAEYVIDFVRQGAHLQLTTSSINGELGTTIEHASLTMLRAGVVSFIASDAHNLETRPFANWNRTREIVSAMPEVGVAGFERMGVTNPKAVFEGTELQEIDVDAEVENFLTAQMPPTISTKPKRKRFFIF